MGAAPNPGLPWYHERAMQTNLIFITEQPVAPAHVANLRPLAPAAVVSVVVANIYTFLAQSADSRYLMGSRRTPAKDHIRGADHHLPGHRALSSLQRPSALVVRGTSSNRSGDERLQARLSGARRVADREISSETPALSGPRDSPDRRGIGPSRRTGCPAILKRRGCAAIIWQSRALG